jgi:hypothetical protein
MAGLHFLCGGGCIGMGASFLILSFGIITEVLLLSLAILGLRRAVVAGRLLFSMLLLLVLLCFGSGNGGGASFRFCTGGAAGAAKSVHLLAVDRGFGFGSIGVGANNPTLPRGARRCSLAYRSDNIRHGVNPASLLSRNHCFVIVLPTAPCLLLLLALAIAFFLLLLLLLALLLLRALARAVLLLQVLATLVTRFVLPQSILWILTRIAEGVAGVAMTPHAFGGPEPLFETALTRNDVFEKCASHDDC